MATAVWGAIRNFASDNGLINKKSAWLQYNGDLIGQGREAARQALIEKPDLAQKIIDSINEKRSPAPAQPVAT